jgi:hypothetical protein
MTGGDARYKHEFFNVNEEGLTVLAPEPPPTHKVPLAAIAGGGVTPSAMLMEALVKTDSKPKFQRLLGGLFSWGATASYPKIEMN